MDHFSFDVQKIRLLGRGRTFLFVICNCQGVVVLVSAKSCLKCFLLPANILKKNLPNLWTGSKLFFSGSVFWAQIIIWCNKDIVLPLKESFIQPHCKVLKLSKEITRCHTPVRFYDSFSSFTNKERKC